MNETPQGRVFIGHGRSHVWKDLKDFLQDRLNLKWEEFNREASAGFSTKERLEAMLDNSSFAFLLMTSEDEYGDGLLHARANVIHEIGLFQGPLGFSRAVILLEKGCAEFSNIHGISQIRFPRGNISGVFEEIRRVLEREGIIAGVGTSTELSIVQKKGINSVPEQIADQDTTSQQVSLLDISARKLLSTLEQLPPIQAQRLAKASYIGKRVRWRGMVEDVSEINRGIQVCSLQENGDYPWIFISFQSEWLLKLEHLSRGDKIQFEGKLEEIGNNALTLTEGKLL